MYAPIRSSWLGIGVVLALSTANGLAAPQAPQPPMPESAIPMDKVVPMEAKPQVLIPVRLPDADVIIEVVAALPARAQLTDVTRRLGRRHLEARGRNNYLPTMAELIMLVEPNPAKPPGRDWKSITMLTIGYDEGLKTVSVEYCVDECTLNKKTRAPHPKRKMIVYSAPEEQVLTRLEERLVELKQYGDPETKPQ